MTGDTRLYFAYGSNMHSPRLRQRVGPAEFVDTARLPGYMVVFRKHGRDGSAKCDLEPLASATAWGVVYRLAEEQLPALDAAEGEGYRRKAVVVATRNGLLDAFTYQARPGWRTDDRPFDWYLELVLAGAHEHGLPEVYVTALAETRTRPDADAERARRNRP